MKYKLLKVIETVDSLPIGTVFEPTKDYIQMDNGMRIPCKLLIEQGFIEEVKEAPKPRWKVGDYVVKTTSDRTRFIKVSEVEEIYKGEFRYDGYGDLCFRDPTPEELSTYFR